MDGLRACKNASSNLRATLEKLKQAEARAAGQLCYGLPPEWRTKGSSAGRVAAGSSASSGGEWSGQWQEGTEVCYTPRLTEQAGAQRLKVSRSEKAVRLQLYRRPFAHGGLREAFYAK